MKSFVSSALLTLGVVLLLIFAYGYLFSHRPEDAVSAASSKKVWNITSSEPGYSPLPVYKPSYSSNRSTSRSFDIFSEGNQVTGSSFNEANGHTVSHSIGTVEDVLYGFSSSHRANRKESTNTYYPQKSQRTHWQDLSSTSLRVPFSEERKDLAQNTKVSTSRPQRVGGDTDPGEPGLPVGDGLYFLLGLGFIYGGFKYFATRK
ncbi:MAG TPA: hypothetical protein PK903_07805 [Paludibacteraceae bacterium]|nr:hypothetical protein [Paludibacteraceae bacterium]